MNLIEILYKQKGKKEFIPPKNFGEYEKHITKKQLDKFVNLFNDLEKAERLQNEINSLIKIDKKKANDLADKRFLIMKNFFREFENELNKLNDNQLTDLLIYFKKCNNNYFLTEIRYRFKK